MSQSTARAARQATGEPYFKDVKKPTKAHETRAQRAKRVRAENVAHREAERKRKAGEKIEKED